MFRLVLASLAALAVTVTSATAAPPPKVSIGDYAQLQTPLPYPYDERADGEEALARALAQAKAQHKRVLVDLGGNWCGDCRILAATMDLPEMKTFLDRHFVTVAIDVGRMDKNMQIPARYGLKRKLEGVPALLVIDPATGRQLVSESQIAALADARHMRPQALADWLAKWAP